MTMTLTSTPGSEPAALQWTWSYDPANVTNVSATIASGAAGAGKTLQCAAGAGSYTCILSGLNISPIPNGPVAILNATMSGTAAASVLIGVANTVGASVLANAVSLNGTGGTISVSTSVNPPGNPPSNPPSNPPGNPPSNPPGGSPGDGSSITALVCNPTEITSGASATCTISLSGPAPDGGEPIMLSSSSGALKAPATVTVAAASTSVDFSVTADVITFNQSVVLAAVLNDSSRRIALSLVPPSGPPPPSVPTISGLPAGVLDAASYTPNLAPGGIFVVKGSNLCPDGTVQGAYPLSTTLNGVSIAVTPVGGGAAVPAYLVYTYARGGVSQLAALLPSSVAPGNYNLAVTRNGTTGAPVPISVVPHKFGLFTADSSGSGMASLQIIDSAGAYHSNRFTTGSLKASGASIAPAHPGDYVIAYGTGLGPVQVPDQAAAGVLDMRNQATIQVLVGGEAITPLYAGRSPGYAGLDQINLQLPADVPTGCTVTMQVSVGGQLSQAATIAIAPAGQDVCSPAPVSGAILSRLDQGGSLTLGNFWLTQLTPSSSQPSPAGLATLNESALGAFVSYSGFQLASAAPFLNTPGFCQVSQIVGNAAQLVFGPVTTQLDAGNLTLNGPGISGNFAVDSKSQTYTLPLGVTNPLASDIHLPLGFPSFNVLPVISPGTYQLTGSGGADVGAFFANVTVGQRLTLSSGLPMVVDRTHDLTISWTGGSSNDLVSVTGISGAIIGGTQDAPIYNAGRLTCTTTAVLGSITIPAALLAQLPATPNVADRGIGYLGITSGAAPGPGNGLFTAPLTAGGTIDDGFFLGTLGVFGTTSYQ